MAFTGPAWHRAIRLIDRVCRIAAPRDFGPGFIDDPSKNALQEAVASHDTPALYNWLIEIFAYQGIADRIARSWMDDNGRVTWHDVETGLQANSCQCAKLTSYWTFHGCRYRKGAGTCANRDKLSTCIVPAQPARNGRLAQLAMALFLFIRDVCNGDLVTWMQERLDTKAEPSVDVIIAALRHVFGVSDKVLSLALTTLLTTSKPHDTHWIQAGQDLVVVDTLVHNWLHRTGILQDLHASHPYGPRCYAPGGCADILRQAAQHIDARLYGPHNPRAFPRLVQSAIWRFCAIDMFNICNGRRIKDNASCTGDHCPVQNACRKVALRQSRKNELFLDPS
ncbi:MAG: hypothetical protein AB7F96_05500 [Beijerinckiaceae bacterium]